MVRVSRASRRLTITCVFTPVSDRTAVICVATRTSTVPGCGSIHRLTEVFLDVEVDLLTAAAAAVRLLGEDQPLGQRRDYTRVRYADSIDDS